MTDDELVQIIDDPRLWIVVPANATVHSLRAALLSAKTTLLAGERGTQIRSASGDRVVVGPAQIVNVINTLGHLDYRR